MFGSGRDRKRLLDKTFSVQRGNSMASQINHMKRTLDFLSPIYKSCIYFQLIFNDQKHGCFCLYLLPYSTTIDRVEWFMKLQLVVVVIFLLLQIVLRKHNGVNVFISNCDLTRFLDSDIKYVIGLKLLNHS